MHGLDSVLKVAQARIQVLDLLLEYVFLLTQFVHSLGNKLQTSGPSGRHRGGFRPRSFQHFSLFQFYNFTQAHPVFIGSSSGAGGVVCA